MTVKRTAEQIAADRELSRIDELIATKFCVRGGTPEMAICNTALKAYGLA